MKRITVILKSFSVQHGLFAISGANLRRFITCLLRVFQGFSRMIQN